MATEIKSQQELLDLFITALQAEAADLTDDTEGSIIDTLAGVFSFGATEINRAIIDKFNKTYFATAHGPEVTGGDDDLQTLAVDHFGDTFARPLAAKATGTVAFSRPTSLAGPVVINAGTIVKTAPNANGEAQRFSVTAGVTLTTLTINASVEAVVGGLDGNVSAGAINEIETALTDPTVVVTNAAQCAGGEPTEDDATYRETIRNKIESLAGATLAAVQSKAKTVAGVETATAVEDEIPVIQYDISTGLAAVGAAYFRIPYVTLYIADANGTASAGLILSVKEALEAVRAAGVRIDVAAASALVFNWTAEISLNPAGPNYAELSSDPTKILESMTQYVNELPIGGDFIKATADAAILAIWGPSGTNDLTDFTTVIPSGNVDITASQKLVAGDMEIA